MHPIQLILTATALLTAAGGLLMLFRLSRGSDSPRRAYIALATTAVGLIIAYRSISGFDTMDAEDLTIMFLFALGLLSMIGLQFFVTAPSKHDQEPPETDGPDRNPQRNS
jgi:hypothetical protein